MLEDTGAWWESVIITTEKGGVCATDDECRRGQSCVTDETALICESTSNVLPIISARKAPVLRACVAGVDCLQPTNRPVDPIPPTGG